MTEKKPLTVGDLIVFDERTPMFPEAKHPYQDHRIADADTVEPSFIIPTHRQEFVRWSNLKRISRWEKKHKTKPLFRGAQPGSNIGAYLENVRIPTRDHMVAVTLFDSEIAALENQIRALKDQKRALIEEHFMEWPPAKVEDFDPSLITDAPYALPSNVKAEDVKRA